MNINITDVKKKHIMSQTRVNGGRVQDNFNLVINLKDENNTLIGKANMSGFFFRIFDYFLMFFNANSKKKI